MSTRAGKQAVPAERRCPKCGKSELKLVADPKTGQAYKTLGHYMAICPACGERKALDEIEGLVFIAQSTREGPIEGDHACPRCSYNMRGHRVGDKCPECGLLVETMSTIPAAVVRRPLGVWGWLAVAYGACWIGYGVVAGKYPTLRKLELVLLFFAFGAIGYGTKGLATRRITLSPRMGSSEYSGGPAIVVGSLYVLFGMGLLSLAAALWFNLLK